MTICNITGYACNCQPDEGALCNGADELRKACDAWRKKAEQFRGELSLAEEGLANYTQENGQFKKALEMIRDGEIPQAMSPALFAEFVLRGPVPHPSDNP